MPLLSSVSSEESSLRPLVLCSVPTGPEEPVPTDVLPNTCPEDGLNPAADGGSVCFNTDCFPLWVVDVIFSCLTAPVAPPRSDEQAGQGYTHTPDQTVT